MSLAPPPGPIRDETPSTKHVYRCLQLADGTVSQQELAEATGFRPKTVRNAMQTIIDAGLAKKAPSIDARRARYRLVSPEK